MASRSHFSSTLLFFAVLFFAVSFAVNVAARSVNHQADLNGQHRDHALVSTSLSETFELVNVLELYKPDPASNELPEFQIAVREKGVLKYLYAQGEQVLSTANPDSVGTARTMWKVVEAPSDRHALSFLSFALQNKDTGARLYYNCETKCFFLAWVEGGQASPFTNWRLWNSVEEPSRSKLQSNQVDCRGLFAQWSAGDEPFIFHIISRPRPLRQFLSDRVVRVEVGTKFQLTVLENGKELYLYSEGEKVLRTENPDSVGTARTIWESVPGWSPFSMEYADAFSIRNTDTGAALVYNGDFIGQFFDFSGILGWKLFISIIRPAEYRLQYLPYSNGFNGLIFGRFNYLPLSQGIVSLKIVA